MRTSKRTIVVLISTGAMLAASVIATAAMTSSGGSSPDLPPRFAQLGEHEGNYLQLREQYIDGLRGIQPGAFANPGWRASAVRARQRELTTLRQESSPAVASSWHEIGPDTVSNGQALDGSTIHVSGRVTSIAVDPSDSNKVWPQPAQV